MRTLIAVVSARHRSEWRKAIRETWLPLVPITKAEVKFFVGSGDSPIEPDVVELDCDDSYQGLPEKIREITRWALKNQFDYMLKCDDDVILRPEGILYSGYENHLYSGKTNRYPTTEQPFPVTVGFNYWLHKDAMKLVSEHELPPELGPGVKDNDDEKWVAGIMHDHGIKLHHDHRYEIYGGELPEKEPTILYRPLRPPKVNSEQNREAFSWTIFLEANSGNGIPLDIKIKEFYKVFNKLYNNPQA